MKFKHFSKFEIAGIGSLKGVHVAAYGLSLMSLHQMLSKYWGFIFIFKKTRQSHSRYSKYSRIIQDEKSNCKRKNNNYNNYINKIMMMMSDVQQGIVSSHGESDPL